MEIGTIVGRSFAAKGEIVPSDLPAGRAAHFQLKGPFDGMPGAWQTLFAWCQAEKLELAGINWEPTCPGRASIPPSSRRISTRFWRDLGPLRTRDARGADRARHVVLERRLCLARPLQASRP